MAIPSTQGPIRFGTFEADLRAGELRKQGTKIKLQGQPFQVLQVLLEQPGQIVTREELQQKIWPADTFVDFDHGLNNAIRRLRESLNDSAENPRFIETLSRRGYRFIGKVQNGPSATSQEVRPSPTAAEMSLFATHKRRFAWGAVFGAALVAALTLVLGLNMRGMRDRLLGKSIAPRIQSLAVLPLQNLSSDPAQEFFSDGLTDSLITDLAQIGSLKVISHTSAARYRKTDKSLPEIAHELNVDGIIEGTVQRSGDRLRINVQLIHGPTDRHLWANSYEGDSRNVLALERSVTEDIARQIRARLTATKLQEQTQPWPMDPKALEAYLQGRYHYNLSGKGFGDEEKRNAAQYFEQAVAADPNFAPAYNWLALAHENLLLGSREDVAASWKAAEKAVAIDPNFSDARITLAAIKWMPSLDWRGVEEDFKRNLAINPDSAVAHSAMGILLTVLGRREEGLRESRIAQRLDPYDDDAALGLYLGRDYDGSIAMLRILLQPDPKVGLWHCDLFPNFAMKGMHKEFIEELAQCFSLYGLSEAAANIQHAFASMGYREAVFQWAQEVERLQTTHKAFLPGQLAEAYSILGDKDQAFYWLDQAYEHREMDSFDTGIFFLGAEPMYDPLRSDSRFADLVRRIGLPP